MTEIGYANPLRRMIWLLPRRVSCPTANPAEALEVVGHRGSARVQAENTLPSFRAAVAAGADAIETDVCTTRDGKLVLWHDCYPTATVALARQTGREDLLVRPDVPHLFSPVRRPVFDLNWDTFRRHYGYRVRTGGWRDLLGAGDGTPQIPVSTLDELLEWAPREPRLRRIYLDLKFTARQTEAVNLLIDTLETFLKEKAGPRFAFGCLSGEVEILEALKRRVRRRIRDSSIEVFGDFERPGALDFAARLGLESVSLGLGQRLWPGFRRELCEVLEARNRGALRSVIVWTFNEEERLEELLEMGVDAILTDDPALLRQTVDRERPGQPSVLSG